MARRVSNNGWDGEILLQELRHLPRSMPQGHRWFLLKIHLKAPMTLARIAKARADVEAEPCHLCGGQTDAVEHVTTCELVCGAYDIVSRPARLPANPGGMRTLMLQERMDGGTLAGIVAFYAAIWTTRRTCRKLGRTISVGGAGRYSSRLHAVPLASTLHEHHDTEGKADSAPKTATGAKGYLRSIPV